MRSSRQFVFVVLALTAASAHAQTLQLGETASRVGGIAEVPLTLASDQPVEGLVAAFGWDGGGLVGSGLEIAPSIANADTVVVRVEDDYAVLGVVVDADGVGEDAIPPGADILLAIAKLRCTERLGATSLEFEDGKYSTTDGGPLLDNLVVVGGEAVEVADGLALVSGSVECSEGLNRFFIGATEASVTTVMMENGRDVEGYTIALCHPPSLLHLLEVQPGRAALDVGAEFVDVDVLETGGLLAVILDIEPPFAGQTIAPGDKNEIGRFTYDCLQPSPDGALLEFCDEVLGSPALSNTTVAGGLAVFPALENGSLVCEPAVECPECQPAFACGPEDYLTSDSPEEIPGTVGAVAEVFFYLQTPQAAPPDDPWRSLQVQGFSMALSFDCRLEAGGELDITDTILEAVGAEFVSAEPDNTPDDGDGCELIVAVLVDAAPPFDGAAIPPLLGFQKMGSVEFTVDDDDSLCGERLEIVFEDGARGAGGVPIYNVASIDNDSVPAVTGTGCAVVPSREGIFYRGDCDFSGGPEGLALNINDAGAMISMFFDREEVRFEAPCLDSCDCNDDGRLDLADTMCVLLFLFDAGHSPPPPGPGVFLEDGIWIPHGPGTDPTPDLLDCDAGSVCP